MRSAVFHKLVHRLAFSTPQDYENTIAIIGCSAFIYFFMYDFNITGKMTMRHTKVGAAYFN